MLETRALFIGLREALGRWHLCGIHIGATWEICRQVMQMVNIQSCVSKLEGRCGGQRCKRCGRHERCEKCEGSSHMCEHTLRTKRGFSKVFRINKWD